MGARPFKESWREPEDGEGPVHVAAGPAGGFGRVVPSGQVQGADGEVSEGGHGPRPGAGADGGVVFAVEGVADVVQGLHLSSRVRLWVVWGGVFGEFWVDSGGPAAYLVAVRAERGEFVGVGVQDPAVCAPGFLPSVEESSLSPGVDGAGGDAELGGQLGEEPFVLAGCLAGVRGLGGAAVGDGVPAAAQDLFDQSPADRSVAAVG